MKVLELFAGTRSIGKAFEAHGHEVFSVEWDKHFENIDLYADIMTVTADDIIQRFGRPDVIWASPDCTTFSIAAISHHRRKNAVTGNLDPVSEYARFCDAVDQHVLQLIKELRPRFYFWTNHPDPQFKPICKNGDPCHDRAPRSATLRKLKEQGVEIQVGGTQYGMRGSKERSVIPEALCQHIVEICEKPYDILY